MRCAQVIFAMVEPPHTQKQEPRKQPTKTPKHTEQKQQNQEPRKTRRERRSFVSVHHVFLARVETPCVRSAQVIFAKGGNSASSKRESKNRKGKHQPNTPNNKTTKTANKNPREDHCRVSALYIMVTLSETRELWRLAIWASNSI